MNEKGVNSVITSVTLVSYAAVIWVVTQRFLHWRGGSYALTTELEPQGDSYECVVYEYFLI